MHHGIATLLASLLSQLDTLNLVQNARDYTPMRVGQFLEGVGLGHHVDAFCDAEISGEVLLDATEEMLEELGVTSATERLKIKVNWGVTTLGQGSG